MYQETADGTTSPNLEGTSDKLDQELIPPPDSQDQSSSPFQRGLVWGAIFTVTAAMSAGMGAAVTLVTPLDLTPVIKTAQSWLSPITPQTKAAPEPQPARVKVNSPFRLTRPMNLLVMGIEPVTSVQAGNPEAFSGRSDTVLLARFEPGDDSVNLLSIPRDSRVEAPNLGSIKIDEINVTGGPALTARVLSKTLNDVPIDRYVRISADGFQELVNFVGGVEVFVPYPMSYIDRTQNLVINLEAGWQTLDGQQAEQFVRFREEKYGDLGRVQRQQILLEALQKSLQNPAILPKIPQGMRILQQYVDTNLTLEEMLALAYFSQQLGPEGLQMVILPGQFSREGEQEREDWLISERGRDRVMGRYFGLNSPEDVAEKDLLSSRKNVRVAIQNATSDPGLGTRIVSYLVKQDFGNTYVTENAPQILSETAIIVQQGDLESANLVKSALGLGRIEASSIGDLNSEVTIRVGQDAKQLQQFSNK